MNRIEIVRKAFSFPTPDESGTLLSDDFQSTDEVGSPPMDKATWIGMGEVVRTSFPDMDYVIEDIQEEAAGIKVKGHFVGTFTSDLDLSAMGMDVIPASGQKITWPTGTGLATVEGGKLTKVHNTDTGPDAGISGFYRALGVG